MTNLNVSVNERRYLLVPPSIVVPVIYIISTNIGGELVNVVFALFVIAC